MKELLLKISAMNMIVVIVFFNSFNNKKEIYCGDIYNDTLLPFSVNSVYNTHKIKKYIKELLDYHNIVNKVINLDI